jgi:hypothetical protein
VSPPSKVRRRHQTKKSHPSAPRNSRDTSSYMQDSSIKNSVAVEHSQPRRLSSGGNNYVDVTRRITSGSNGMPVSINIPSSPSHNIATVSLNRPPLFYFHPEENALREMLLQNRLDQLRSALSPRTTIPCFFTPNSMSEVAAPRQV